MRKASRLAALVGLAVLAVALGACGGSAEAVEDESFGARDGAGDGEERETLLITPPDSTEEFFYYPAYFSDVEVRTGPVTGGRRPVELLIRGALPDGCTALHYIGQERRGNLIDVTFEMRKPKGAVCTQVVRPYRFYYTLDEPLPPGDYTLTVNGDVEPFTVLPPREGEIGG
jgi:hypothetical protein